MYNTKVKVWTSKPEDWPQKKFNTKKCKNCFKEYQPNSPCNLYCSEDCSKEGKASRYLERTYGITIDDYKSMAVAQDHKCLICGGPGFKLKESHNLVLVVDHCHRTGTIRGLLCPNCNRGLGLFQDNPEFLQLAKSYVEGATTIPKGSTPKRVEAPDPSTDGDDIV